MIQEALNFAQSKPVTTGLIVIGGGALAYFALAGGGSSDTATLDNSGSGLLYTRPSDAEIVAASSIADSQIRAQRESEDSQIAAVLGSQSLSFQYDLTKQRQNNELADIQGKVAVAQRSYDVALANTNTMAELARYQEYAAYKSLVYKSDTAFNLQQNQNWADYDSLKYNRNADLQLASIEADERKRIAELDAITATNVATLGVRGIQEQGNNAVRAAEAGKKTGFSIGIPGIGSIGASW